MVALRNRSAQSVADRDAPEHQLEVLRSGSAVLANRFRGLNAEMLLGGYNEVRSVTFKEVASLINAAHHLVAELDSRHLNSLDLERFLKDVIWDSLGNTKKPSELIAQARKRRAISIWGTDPSDRGDAVLALLKHQGFSSIATRDFAGAVVPAELVERLQEHTPGSILTWAYVSD